jgi:hypothetical protein
MTTLPAPPKHGNREQEERERKAEEGERTADKHGAGAVPDPDVVDVLIC